MQRMIATIDRANLTTKEYTADGFLKGRARAIKPGIVTFDASEIGVGPRGKTVRVNYTPESVYHPATKASANGAAMTLNHPAAFVTPDTWRSVAVGNVTGDADEEKDDTGGLSVPFILGDRRAIEQADKGSQVSVGKWMRLEKAPENSGADYATVGPFEINHIALAQKGRMGPQIRVMDSMEPDAKQEFVEALTEAIMARSPGVQVTDSIPGTFAQPAPAPAPQQQAEAPETGILGTPEDSQAKREYFKYLSTAYRPIKKVLPQPYEYQPPTESRHIEFDETDTMQTIGSNVELGYQTANQWRRDFNSRNKEEYYPMLKSDR